MSFAPTRYPSRTFSGGESILVSLKRYRCAVEATPTVFETSIAVNSIAFSAIGTSFGGMICVIYPLSSCENASGLNPDAFNALAPKFEFEVVIYISPPVATRKCSVKPIANIETACITELLLHLIWKLE